MFIRLLFAVLLVASPAMAGETILQGIFPFDEMPRNGSSKTETIRFAGQVFEGCELLELELSLAVSGRGHEVEIKAKSSVRNSGRHDRRVSLTIEVDAGGYEPVQLLVIDKIDAEEGQIEDDKEKVTLPTAVVRSATKPGAKLMITMVVSE